MPGKQVYLGGLLGAASLLAGCEPVPCKEYFPESYCIGPAKDDMQVALMDLGDMKKLEPADMREPCPAPTSMLVKGSLIQPIALRYSNAPTALLHSQGKKIFQGDVEKYSIEKIEKIENFAIVNMERLFIATSGLPAAIVLKDGLSQNRLAGYYTAPVDLLHRNVNSTDFLYVADPARIAFPVGVGRIIIKKDLMANVTVEPASLVSATGERGSFALALTNNRDALYASYPAKGWIVKFLIKQDGSLDPGTVIRDMLDQPEGLATDTEGNLYIATAKGLIARHPNNQECFLSLNPRPHRLAFDNQNNLYYSTDTEIRSVTLSQGIVGVP